MIFTFRHLGRESNWISLSSALKPPLRCIRKKPKLDWTCHKVVMVSYQEMLPIWDFSVAPCTIYRSAYSLQCPNKRYTYISHTPFLSLWDQFGFQTLAPIGWYLNDYVCIGRETFHVSDVWDYCVSYALGSCMASIWINLTFHSLVLGFTRP